MNYEKKYKEALELARDYYKANQKLGESEENEVLSDIFPELKESKDVKIRKAIIESLPKYGYLPQTSIKVEDAIAWLEKQCEQKAHLELKDGKRYATTIIAVNGANSTAITDGNTSVTSKEVEKQYCTGQYEPDVREFPIEWKEENVDELSEFERAMMHIGGSFFGEKAGLDPNSTDDVKEQAELLLSLVPKQGWSEEDEQNLANSAKTRKDEQTPAWSEEDECYMVECINAIATKDGWSFEEKRKTRHWLKSLKDRYTWKPSDEQMDALQYVFRNINPPLSDKLGWDSIKTLELLYHDLKKLKEE